MRSRDFLIGCLQGFIPGMFGVTHGALQFMTYEEMKAFYNEYRRVPLNNKLVMGGIFPAMCSMFVFADNCGVFGFRGRFKIDRCSGHLSVSGDKGPTSGSASQLWGYLGLYQENLEVREDQGLLQGIGSVLAACHSEYMSSHAYLWEIHQLTANQF